MSTHRLPAPPPAPGGTKPPDPQPSACALSPRRQPPPLTRIVPWSGGVGVAAAPKLTAWAPPSSRPPTGGGDGCSSREGTSRIKSGTSPATEWLKQERPRPLRPQGALARGSRWAVRPSPAPHSPLPSPAPWGGCACLLGWGGCACVGERCCWGTVALGLTAAAAASPGSSQYPLSSPSTPLCREVSKSPPASAPPPRLTSTPSPLPCEAPAPLHL